MNLVTRWPKRPNACTDGAGETRAERKAIVYEKLQKTKIGRFAKLVDRLANVIAGGKVDMYAKEHSEFQKRLQKREDNLNQVWIDLRRELYLFNPTIF